MEATMEAQAYPLALSEWDGEGSLRVDDSFGQELMIFPIQFLRIGKVVTYNFVYQQLKYCYVQQGLLYTSTGDCIQPQDAIQKGVVTYRRQDSDSEPFTPIKGPRFKSSRRPAIEGDGISTMSNSKRSTCNQRRFRESLLARDSSCLVSGVSYETCTACHILPQSRPEYYTEVLGYNPGYLFFPSYGLLLRDDLHHSFDRGEWALYPMGDDLVVHMFVLADDSFQDFHGKVINRSRFHTAVKNHPDHRLLNFHYQQCSIKRFRGFSA